MGPIYLTSFGVPPNTSIASSRARSRLTCQCRSAGTSQVQAGDQPEYRQGGAHQTSEICEIIPSGEHVIRGDCIEFIKLEGPLAYEAL
jgi:hypothetical protein